MSTTTELAEQIASLVEEENELQAEVVYLTKQIQAEVNDKEAGELAKYLSDAAHRWAMVLAEIGRTKVSLELERSHQRR